MATARRRSTPPADAEVDDFLGTSNIIPGEVLLTLAPGAAADMTASVPTHPAGPVLGMVGELGVSDLDAVLADLGAHDITRLAAPPADGSGVHVLGVETVEDHVLARSFRVRLAQGVDVEDAVARLNKVGSVEVAEPNRYRFAQDVTPNDPRYPQQWGLPRINAPAAWSRTTGAASVVVAVIDSGCDLSHPDLAGLLVPGFDMVDLGVNPTPPPGFRFEGDFAGRDTTPDDEVGHGTHVAGTIAALSGNGAGVAGVTWNCRLMPVKALTRLVRISDGAVRGTGSSADVAAAVRWAADNGASIINMSLGSSGTTTVESSAVAYAISRGCVVVAAMGNDGSANPSYPAAYPDVVSVGATDSADRKATFSQTGAHIDVVAPGVEIWSTVPGGYGSKSGTSMATPHVAGVAALIRSVKPSATVSEVTDILRTTARALRDAPADPVPNNSYGWGLVDAAAAVNKAKPLIVRTLLPLCETIRTVLPVACRPRVVRTLACPPIRTLACNVPITIQTIRAAQPFQAAAYDPYGYLGAYGSPYSDSSDVYDPCGDQAGSGYQAPSEWEAGYQAGYLAALAAVETQAAEAAPEGAGEPAAAEAGGGVAEQGLWPRTVLVVDCLPRTLIQCPPRTLLPRCPIITRGPRCPVTITRPPTTIPTVPTTFPTTTNPPTTPIAGAPDWSGYDPYGQTPFQG